MREEDALCEVYYYKACALWEIRVEKPELVEQCLIALIKVMYNLVFMYILHYVIPVCIMNFNILPTLAAHA